MDQKVWGPHTWFFLHSVTLNYPFSPTKTDKSHIVNFFKEIEDILPCSVCRRHYKNHLNKHPIRNGSRKELVYWLIDLHNIVNIQEQKKTMSYKAVIDMYSKKYNKKILLENSMNDSNINKKANDEFRMYTNRNTNESIDNDNKCMDMNIWYISLIILITCLIILAFMSCASCSIKKLFNFTGFFGGRFFGRRIRKRK